MKRSTIGAFANIKIICNAKSWVCCSVVDRGRRQSGDQPKVYVYGLKLEKSDEKSQTSDDKYGVPELLAGTGGEVRLFGTGWTDNITFALTTIAKRRNEKCDTYTINPSLVSVVTSGAGILVGRS